MEKASFVSFFHLPFRSLNSHVTSRMISGEEAMLVEHRVKKGHVSSEESHPNEQITLVLQGCLRFVVEGTLYVLRPGDAILIQARAVHSCEVLEDSEVFEVFSPPRKEWIDHSS